MIRIFDQTLHFGPGEVSGIGLALIIVMAVALVRYWRP